MHYEMKRYRFVLLPLISGLVIFLTTTLFALPKVKTIIELKEKLVRDRERLARLTEKVSLLEGFDQYELEKKVVAAEKALPSKKVVAEILVDLSSLSSENQVSFGRFEISPGLLFPEKFEELTFKASFEGPRDKIENLLGRIYEVLPVMKIVSFNLRGEKATLEIESCFSPLPESLGKIDTPLAKISKEEDEVYQKISQLKGFEGALPLVPSGKDDPFSEL